MYICPVCGFPDLDDPPAMFSICPCCGTEFELDDAFKTHAELREIWLGQGAPWWSQDDTPPANWDPHSQLETLVGERLMPSRT